jgi:hypothetical protein
MSTTFKKEKKRKEKKRKEKKRKEKKRNQCLLEGKQNYCCPMNLGEM